MVEMESVSCAKDIYLGKETAFIIKVQIVLQSSSSKLALWVYIN